jgi:hypothetical protein
MNTPARIALGCVAIGAILLGGAALSGPSAGADTGTDADPSAQLHGGTGFNSWTTTAVLERLLTEHAQYSSR